MSTITVKYIDTTKYKIRLHHDDAPEDPTSWDAPDDRPGSVAFVLYHRNYTLPCEIEAYHDEYDNYTDMAARHPEIKGRAVRYVRWYEHSGVAVSLRDAEDGHGWDAGIAGIIVGDTVEDIEREFETWRQYIEGEVYGVTIETEAGDDVDSLWGLYGDEAVKEYIYETIPDAVPDNVDMQGQHYQSNETYDLYFDYADIQKKYKK